MAVAKKRHKSFTPKNRAKPEPLSFDLYDQTFTAHPELQGAVILDFASRMSAEVSEDGDENSGGGSASAALILNFFDDALLPEDLKRFKKLIRDPETIVEAELLAEIVGWLMEEYTGRDLADASDSQEHS